MGCAAHAQKLPNVQVKGIRAPDNIKIDGKAIEWNNQFQAYNKATNLFYTISNDDENLYLIIQADGPVYITKILSGGITFTVNKSGEKNTENAISVTYPIIDPGNKPNVHFQNIPVIVLGDKTSVLKADSFMNDNNRRVTNSFKWIRITGIKGLDTLTSVYNREGVKAAGLFDNKMVYTCEFLIALKYLGLSVQNPTNFSYQIVSNGINLSNLDGGPVTIAPPPGSRPGTIAAIAGPPQGGYNFNRNDFKVLISNTNFWGQYILKK